jgi:hypothetical protein
MHHIDQQTRRKMLQAFSLFFVMLAFPNVHLIFSDHSAIPLAICSLIALPALFSLLPLIAKMNEQKREQALAARDKWRAAYKTSPESHLLDLSD